jgi:hypothetical protein
MSMKQWEILKQKPITYKQRVKNLLYYKAVTLRCYAFISPEILADVDRHSEEVWRKFCKVLERADMFYSPTDENICPQCYINYSGKIPCEPCVWGALYGICKKDGSAYNKLLSDFKCEYLFDVLNSQKILKIIGGL